MGITIYPVADLHRMRPPSWHNSLAGNMRRLVDDYINLAAFLGFNRSRYRTILANSLRFAASSPSYKAAAEDLIDRLKTQAGPEKAKLLDTNEVQFMISNWTMVYGADMDPEVKGKLLHFLHLDYFPEGVRSIENVGIVLERETLQFKGPFKFRNKVQPLP